MKRRALSLLLAVLPLSAQSWRPELGAVWTRPEGDLRQVGDAHGWGGMIATELQADESGSVRLFAEYRRFWTVDTRYSLSDAGMLLSGQLAGPLYGTIGASAERVHLPGHEPSIKLGTRVGLGYNLAKHFKLEGAYTYCSLDHASVNSVEASLVLAF
jgi:hypothetical protein